MKKLLIFLGLFSMLLVGCENNGTNWTNGTVKAYNQSEKDGVVMTYYEMNDGTWKCNGILYKFRLELSGKMPNAADESHYVVLTDNADLTFEDVSRSQYSSSIEDSKLMEGSVIVEMR